MIRNTPTLPPIIPPDAHSSRYHDHRSPYAFSTQSTPPILPGRPQPPLFSPPSASSSTRAPPSTQSSASRPRDSLTGPYHPQYHAELPRSHPRDSIQLAPPSGPSRFGSSPLPWPSTVSDAGPVSLTKKDKTQPESIPKPVSDRSDRSDFSLSTLTAGILSGGSPAPSSRKQQLIDALDALGDRDEVDVFADSYFESLVATGTSTPLLRSELATAIDEVFDLRIMSDAIRYDDTTFHKVALIHMVFALGRLMSAEQRVNDAKSRQSFSIVQQCLVLGNFFTCTSILSLQTLSLMTTFLGYSDISGGNEQSHQLRGMALRLMVAMGLHRDAHNEQMSAADLNQRRRVFWDIYSCDVFSSRALSRPNGISLNQFDSRFPEEFFSPEGIYDLKRCELVLLAGKVLEEHLRIRPEPYPTIVDLWQRIGLFEESIPYELRCRPAAQAQVSRHTTPDAAASYTPATSRKDMGLAFKQHSLMLNSCLAIFTLLRPYFVDALYTHPHEPLHSEYGDAYLAVVERCVMLIAMLDHLHSLFPRSSTRQLHFWSCIFPAAMCLATIPILSPENPLASLAIHHLDTAIKLLQQVQDLVPQQSLRDSLPWLLHLQSRAEVRAKKPSKSSPYESSHQTLDSGLEDWRRRLVQLGRHVSPSGRPDSAGGPQAALSQRDEKSKPPGRLPLHEPHNQIQSYGPGRNGQILDVVRTFPAEMLEQIFGAEYV
ncbi:hypothetical protein BD324DRAFT_651455 [Kockovaella imperatae]|uniref:Xylanolytic transcriptional activator regulatory domain-containing protein n=1 Tax=Kockovaella imperatae TaxID=4999 RepID=A0A1Y1UGM0_9TREE|nr:hypothetical protein BD324DRAFT_651455 [Kockovaella imperatae]ORX36215.1 hypothetical protein BD324DRAFT_651455 [Kockovaella imperatae]